MSHVIILMATISALTMPSTSAKHIPQLPKLQNTVAMRGRFKFIAAQRAPLPQDNSKTKKAIGQGKTCSEIQINY